MSEPLRQIVSKTVVLPTANIDTDQIYPGRFLTVTTRYGLGHHLFADWRYDREGRPRPEFPLNSPQAAGAQVLVAGNNFGCGSSREHAAWALRDAGFRAVVSTSFADIFRSNALKNAVLPVEVDAETHRNLLASPGGEVAIDLVSQTIALPDGTRAAFPIDPFARYCLMEGIDELGFLLQQEEAIEKYERRPSSFLPRVEV